MKIDHIVLIETIPNGYASREFEGIKYCLNSINPGFCEIVKANQNILPMDDTNLYIVADYYFNPTFREDVLTDQFHSYIRSLPKEQTAIYYSDPVFKFNDPEKFKNWDYFVFFGISNYRSTETIEYQNCRIWEKIDIHTKQILDIPISELAFWSYIKMNNGSVDFGESLREHTISYIINSKILSRLSMLTFLNKQNCQLGDFPKVFVNSNNKKLQSFIEHNPECTWESQKVFGVDFLKRQNGRFTLVVDDDTPIKVAWPMRMYEAAAVGILPLIHTEKDESRLVYSNYKKLSVCYFDGETDLRDRLRYFENRKKYNSAIIELRHFMEENVYDAQRLYNKTIDALELVG